VTNGKLFHVHGILHGLLGDDLHGSVHGLGVAMFIELTGIYFSE
jgi:hypothetical protein